MSKINNYFNSIDEYLKNAYSVAKVAKQKGYDPKCEIEIPLAKEISERVEGLVSVLTPQVLNSGIALRILELEKKYAKLDWRVALTIALEVAKEKYCKFKDKKEAMEIGIRIGFSYITLGVISAPLEGFIDLNIKKRKDKREYIEMNFAGPIRAAGGTGGAVSVLIGDYIRQEMGYAKYDPTNDELNRFYTEITDYHQRITRLQYMPSQEEVKMLIKNIGIEISGNPTEKLEVSNYKDLARIKTNRLRGGMCLVVGECLIQKAAKLNKRIEKWGKEFNLEEWLFLKDFLTLQKQIKAKNKINNNKEKEKTDKILPNYKFIEDTVAGRPIFTFPMRKGGFRLRYGRNRTSGFASTCVSRETLEILNEFLAVGTQLKIERPGKSTVITAADNLEPPIVRLKNNNVVKLRTDKDIKKYKNDIIEILHLGDLLISYGEFSENNHKLIPSGYTEEEWAIELVDKINQKFRK